MGKTIFISSHILSELADTCTSVAIVERGELLAAGSIDSILKAIREHRDIEVVVMNDQPGAELFLSHHPKIASVARDEAMLRFEFSGSDEELAVISDELYTRKHRPLWIRENRPDLEAIFMRVTKGRVQ
jgi:ABC-2 type transport system ATP-binding protein